MTAATVGWTVLCAAFCYACFVLGYQAGRDSAERRCAATIADLRVQVKRMAQIGFIDHGDERRPE